MTCEVKKEFGQKAASDYLTKYVSDLKTEHPGKAAATLKRLGARPGDCMEGGSFTLLSHTKENLTVKQQLERFSDYFVAVSQEFPPLQLEQLSAETRQKLADIRPEDIPTVQEYEIFQILDKSKKKKIVCSR